MPTPPGFATIVIPLKHATMTRPAAIVFGVDPTATNAITVADACQDAFCGTGSLKTQMDLQVTIGPTVCYLGTDGTADITGVGTTSSTGNQSWSNVPPNVAALIKKTTSLGGRRGRGRIYLPWCTTTTDWDESGQLGSTRKTALQAAATAFLNLLTTNTVPMVLLHEPSAPGTAHPSAPPAPTPVTQLVVDPLVATQRRRTGR